MCKLKLKNLFEPTQTAKFPCTLILMIFLALLKTTIIGIFNADGAISYSANTFHL